MIVSIVGLGYIGLPTAAILASKRVKVVGVDVNQHAVDIINQGKIHIVEPELDILVHKAIQNNYLKAVTKPEKADVFMMAVPTPFKDNYEPDLSYIKSATKAIATVLEVGNLVILESTSPVGTTEKMMEWMREERPDLSFPRFGDDKFRADIAVTYCPERVLPGQVVRELVENVRIIGGVSTQCAERARELYKIFVEADCLITDCRTAELSKLVENSFRDVNIAFANELSLICDKLDINVWELIKLANRHPRVNILQPGPGVGGHCIAVDPWFIVNSTPDEAKLIRMARLVNDSKPIFVLNKVNQAVQAIGKDKSELSIACLGLAFKPDIDDLRESPALGIAQKIGSISFSSIFLVEPNIDHIPNGFDSDNIELIGLERAVKSADIIVLLVDHASFKSMDLSLLSGKQVIDTRGIWS
ncbi:UDP-N-acetyl-D-mannosamine dehydrogenase [Candidatus Thioglobus sp. NP1]|uniref:UDP-N-acetyl-D-mannosamine dehydrogenase n=1 Tax=Candidatus Thioglobus sp. NP1 TaxID=2508687 RepID=UPI000DED9D92|nr:UDP-N-acetyl-D-mannosamine dehydrogenase [Candidatus Thioglobus sp. NP1]AXE61730.1 UDP-N-acetyl-D-mannosamine dehydrogenase [Candidatus Thioglobus sp. NP1]